MVGVFAGRGDVILVMGVTLVFGVWLGWQLKAHATRLSNWWAEKRSK